MPNRQMSDYRRDVFDFIRYQPECLDALDPRERRILIARRPDADPEPKTLLELSREEGVSRERIRQLEHRATMAVIRLMRTKNGGMRCQPFPS